MLLAFIKTVVLLNSHEKTSDALGGSFPTGKRKGNYRIPKIKIKPIQVSCFMGAPSQRKHLVQEVWCSHCRDGTHRAAKSKISCLKRASHLSNLSFIGVIKTWAG